MRKIIWIPLAVAATAIIIIVAIPFSIERLAEGWLRDQAVPDPSIEDVDFNPFTGVLRVEALALDGGPDERARCDLIEADLEWGALFSGRVELARVTVADGRVDVRVLDDGRIRIGGLTIPLAGAAPAEDDAGAEPWGLGLNHVSFQRVQFGYRDDRFDSRLTLHRLELDRLTTWEPEASSRLVAAMELDGAPIHIEVQATPLAREPTAELALELARLSLGSYPAILAAANLARADGELSLGFDISVQYRQDREIEVDLNGEAALDKIRIEMPAATVTSARIGWSGALKATAPADPSAVMGLSGGGALVVDDFALRQSDPALTLAAFERIDVADIVIHDIERVGIGRLGLRSLELLRAAGPRAAVGAVGLTEISAIEVTGGGTVAIDRALLGDVVVKLDRAVDGRLELVSDFLDGMRPAPAAGADTEVPESPDSRAAPEEPSSTAPVFRLGELEVGGGSRVEFHDNAVVPPLSATVSINRLRVTGIDSSEPEQPLRFEVDIQQPDGASLAVKGDLRPFGELLSSDLEIALARLDLTQLSSYLPAYHIERGRLELESRARLEGETLEVANAVAIDGLKLSGKAAGDHSLLGEGMAMPLDVALDLLRDGDGRIELELPISGSLSDPQFGTGDIVKVAMQNALQKAAIAYAKNALQPLGTIMMIGKLAGKAARPRFAPVSFAPASAELTDEARAYLDKVSQLLADRPGLTLTFCGVSTIADRDALIAGTPPPEPQPGGEPDSGDIEGTPEPMPPPAEIPSFEAERLALARERGGAMQDYLQTARGIDAARLFRCRPTLDPDPEATPRVEITL